ncbi:MBL fold metallo-hydrolase [Pseudodesulfovibrio cashew]|uniref:MBL fold metallo-hydrolase n=1 Tax=Pseudodesulfovibrio cashew TaxID=2678688 RepID=A0A6I6JA15_9BACT|nr:MBL fold metallo-hydrolase [Pseudodesulfovibrio cashew]QGY39666.1 MBL fold metallo-hydrolase [Pseudodesulfovibrio cashew]
MKLTFLVENNSLVGNYLLSESGLSILIEDRESRILLDTGYSDAFLRNALSLNADLLHLDWLVLSHGHYDHTWGLEALIRHYFEAASLKRDVSRPKLLAHPQAFLSRVNKKGLETGILLGEEKLRRQFEVMSEAGPVWLNDRLVALGGIERVFDFERAKPLGKRLEPEGPVDDHIPDDTSLAYVADDGLVVIAGCAHAGICNTVEQAKRITGVDNVRVVLGGFHLQKAKPERLDSTTDYLAELELESLYACHCTDLAAKLALARRCPLREAGTGLVLEF